MKLFALLLVPLMLVSCGDGRHWSERAAQDRIMLVRRDPETLGHKRIVYQAAAHPDFASFLNSSGEPDFIAETSSDSRQYMILYYLDSRNAFACRSWRGSQQRMEFAGPYPMTKKETELLQELKENSIHTADSGIASGRLLMP
ncbi:hypothetical protein ACFQY0_12320 [Haloferula chungangensis]|uniref:Lipoprotein n=1 Tax=Haloferula chungangensis TaxID=1048331 RepID=A0ABW2L6E2_9BACT